MKSKKDEREESKNKQYKRDEKQSKKETTSRKKSTTKEENKTKAEVLKTKNEKGKTKNTIKKPLALIWNIIAKILTIIIIFICIIIVVQKVTNNEEAFLGYRMFRVQTGSMIPKYQIGDVILVKEVDINHIRIGDDITYKGNKGSMNGLLVTHRVIDIEQVDGQIVFHTKGIANNQEDPVVSGEQINGVVQTKMYILSWICNLLNNKYLFYFCGIVPLSIYAAFRLFRGRDLHKMEKEAK